MKKIIWIMILVVAMMITCTGCRQSSRVSYNISKEADSFNVVRQITVIDVITNDVLFQMTGKMAIADSTDKELAVIVEDENGNYKKHYIGLSDNITYIVEDISGEDVSNYKYTLNFNPEMWIPVNVKTID